NSMFAGYLGYLTITHVDSLIPASVGLEISHNHVAVIARLNYKGFGTYSGFGYSNVFGTGYVTIYKNTANYIYALVLDSSNFSQQPPSKLIIDANTVFCTKPFSEMIAEVNLNNYSSAVYVSGGASRSPIYITNNIIIGNPYTVADSTFNVGLNIAHGRATINSNYIKNFHEYGILATNGTCTIKNNDISRGSNVVSAYVYTSSSSTVVDNTLDSTTVDDLLNEVTVDGGAVTNRNINHIKIEPVALNGKFLPNARSYSAGSSLTGIDYINYAFAASCTMAF